MTSVTHDLQVASVTTKANVYFDGKCVSHGLYMADGTKKTVGVILPSTLTFHTVEPEIMECVAGKCEYLLKGETLWKTCSPGERFAIAGHSSFQIKVQNEPFSYICHFG